MTNNIEKQVRARHIKNRAFKGGIIILTLMAILPLIFILYYIIKRGITSISWSFLTQLPKPLGETGGGIFKRLWEVQFSFFSPVLLQSHSVSL